MKKLLCGLVVALVALSGQVGLGDTLDFNFAATDGAQLNFAGNSTFSFTPGDNFVVTYAGPGLASLMGRPGELGGTFTIGALDVNAFGYQHAPVTGTGTFKIKDSAGAWLTASNVQWVDIATFGTLGGINGQATVNMTFSSYSGVDPAFLKLLNSTEQSSTISFTFTPAKALTWLKTHNEHTSFSGSFHAVPAPTSVLGIASLGLVGAVVAWRRWNLAA